MSFTPYGGEGCKSGIVDYRFPPLPVCSVTRDRRCASMPFLFQVQDPPWNCNAAMKEKIVDYIHETGNRYHCPPKCPRFKKPLIRRQEYNYQLTYDNQQAYLNPDLEDRVMTAMAFWFYCDHIPDLPARHKKPMVPAPETARPLDPWPPLPQNVCPPPRECEPCGPGPWANPELRRFFYMDCQ